MKKIIEIKTDYGNKLDMEIMLSNLCNYKCSYCFPGSNEGDIGWPSENFDLMLQNILNLINFYKVQHDKKLFDIKIVGGEPTLWSKLPIFLKSIKDNADTIIRISTNASKSIRYWKKNAELFDKIIISVHNEHANLDHIIEVANTIYNLESVNLYVLVLMDPYNWEMSVKNYEYLLNNSKTWHISVTPVSFNGKTIYTQSQIDYLKSIEKRRHIQPNNLDKSLGKTEFITEDGLIDTNQFEIITNNLNSFKGYSCNIGLDRIYISKEGDIKGACGQNFSNQNLNIYDEDLIKKLINPFKPSICQVDRCSCSSEILISKKVTENE